MGKINDFYSYMFYRVTKAYQNKEIREGSMGTVLVTFSQSMIILDAYIFVMYLMFENPLRATIFNFSKIGIIIGYAFLTVYNYKKYSGKFWSLNNKWGDEERNAKIKNTVFVILAISVPLLLPLIYFTKF